MRGFVMGVPLADLQLLAYNLPINAIAIIGNTAALAQDIINIFLVTNGCLRAHALQQHANASLGAAGMLSLRRICCIHML